MLERLRANLEPLGLAPAEVLSLLIVLGGALALSAVVWWTGQPRPADPDHLFAPAALPGGSEVPTDLDAAAEGVGAAVPTPGAQGPGDVPQGQAATLVVHVAGQVHHPGLVSLPSGSRVAEAITAAGGPTPDAVLDALNLARPLVDGEQVRVPALGEEVAPPDPVTPDVATGDGPDVPLDLNTATAADLDGLPGVGPVTADRILAHRETIGGFVAVTQLLEVPGIGPARFADLEPRVRVGP